MLPEMMFGDLSGLQDDTVFRNWEKRNPKKNEIFQPTKLQNRTPSHRIRASPLREPTGAVLPDTLSVQI